MEKKIKSIKHYLVIKSTGFKRSHLTKKLIKSGHHVTLLDNLLTGKIQNLSSVINYPKSEVIIGNLLDRTLIKTLIRNIDKGYYLVSVFSIKIITVQVIKKKWADSRLLNEVLGWKVKSNLAKMVRSACKWEQAYRSLNKLSL